jgi:hypothetical protein
MTLNRHTPTRCVLSKYWASASISSVVAGSCPSAVTVSSKLRAAGSTHHNQFHHRTAAIGTPAVLHNLHAGHCKNHLQSTKHAPTVVAKQHSLGTYLAICALLLVCHCSWSQRCSACLAAKALEVSSAFACLTLTLNSLNHTESSAIASTDSTTCSVHHTYMSSSVHHGSSNSSMMQ